MSHTPSQSPASSWQASLMRLEAEAREVRCSDDEQVQQLQAKRREVQAKAAQVAEARQRMTARKNRGGEEAVMAPLHAAVLQAEEQQRAAVTAYELALNAFHRQRATLLKKRELLETRRAALLQEVPRGTRQVYSDLIGIGIVDPVVYDLDGRCAACGHLLSDESGDDPLRCPACRRLIFASEV
jgi:rubrerythrin